jgi:hypothetical protein
MRNSRYITLTVNPLDAFNPGLVLGECPPDGRHRMLKPCADFLRDEGYEAEEAVEMLKAWLSRSPRAGEVEDTIRRSFIDIDEEYRYQKPPSKAQPLNQSRVIGLFHKYGGYDALLKFLGEAPEISTFEWLSQLYQPDDLLCIGTQKYDIKIKPLAEWLDQIVSDAKQFKILSRYFPKLTGGYLPLECLLTPATFGARTITKPDGKVQGRCDANVLNRKYFVLESDIAEGEPGWLGLLPNSKYNGFDLQAGIIRHLFDQEYPIVSIVHSGNNSLHVWCSGKGLSDAEINAKILPASVYGVDTHGTTISQFMRLPNSAHPTRPQRLLYFNSDFIYD